MCDAYKTRGYECSPCVAAWGGNSYDNAHKNGRALDDNVMSRGNGTLAAARSQALPPPAYEPNGDTGGGAPPSWCIAATGASTTTTITASATTPGGGAHSTDGWLPSCRPLVLVVILIFLIVVFVLVSGVLIYINYVAYKPKHLYIEESCEKTFCAWGAQCVTGHNGRATCQCPTHCPQIGGDWGQVCGSDGRTYDNHCELRIAACRARRTTKVSHLGKCERSDPCKNKVCDPRERCVVSPDRNSATCQCPNPQNCVNNEQEGPVCGSDGIDYTSKCDLQHSSCRTKANVTVKYQGKCDPCLGIHCHDPEICQLDKHRNPVCRCGVICPLEFTPVCGSDGKTYPNECALRQEACRSQKSLNIIYLGKCSSGANPCKSVQCSWGEECEIDKFGIARCMCPSNCPPIMRPMCAGDGRTYPNECELIRAGCVSRSEINIVHAGVCGRITPCNGHECKWGAGCIERDGKAFCECPTGCSAEFAPVCGSDGVSYGNACKLRRERCLKRREIAVLYQGPCSECESKKCDFYASCESDGFLEARCVCPQSCADPSLKSGIVCGTDGVTYSNECELRIASCKSKQYVITAYSGNCDLCADVLCKYGAHCEAGECLCPTNCDGSANEPVCASNMITYPSECHMQKAACTTANQSLSVAFYGDCRERFPAIGSSMPTNLIENADWRVNQSQSEACHNIHCDFEATCELGQDNYPRCTCRFDCAVNSNHLDDEPGKPVCASDLRMYPSLCAMKMEACQRQKELRIRPLDLCKGMEVKACNGGPPLVDETTGKEIDCGNGPYRQDCPSGSYCHQTSNFAKCCIKDQSELTQKSCDDSWFGCCPDGSTPALGVDDAGCPSICNCNKLGAYEETCDPITRQCRCRPGVGGEKCDRCEPGYWGLPKISSGHQGCIPCGCSTFGSVRDDCEQMTGRCVCKLGIQGQKCTRCARADHILGPNGCVPADLSVPPPATCKELACYFGATCVERPGRYATCECHSECNEDTNPQIVCGNDGQTYPNLCKLRQVACQFQRDIVLQGFGTCRDDGFPGTDWPLRRYTPLQYTQSDDANSPLSKSTRHLLVPDPRYYYESPRPGQLNKNDRTLIVNRHNPEKNTFYSEDYNSSSLAFRPTPATVRVVTALLGDLCSDNNDCLILFSGCFRGACNCLPDYTESSDRKQCIASLPDNPNPTEEYRACTSIPCLNDGKCVDLPSATFTCVCPPAFTGELCETQLEEKKYDTPGFDGHAYVRLKSLKAYHKLTIEMEFKTSQNDGILLYNQQKRDGHGDFVSLAVVNGFVEFRYNLGDGVVVISSLEKVIPERFHRISAKRYHRDGMLQLDDGENVAGQSSGSLRALDLVEDTFVGYIPTNYSRVYENIGTDKGLQGCIRNFKIDRRLVELHERRDEWVVKTEGVHECGSNPCAENLCQNGGKCRVKDTKSFRCDCTGLEYSGSLCDQLTSELPLIRQDPCETKKCVPESIPEFNGTSFLQFPKLEGVSKTFTLEVTLLPGIKNGIVLYNGQMRNGHGDFISLALVRGHVQFRFNLGSGIANLTSEETVTLGKWHHVRLERNGREGSLQVDNGTLIRGFSGPPLTELNLEMPLYVGSVISPQEVHRLAGVTKGFKGAIKHISVNGRPLHVSGNMIGCSFVPANASGCGFDIGVFNGSKTCDSNHVQDKCHSGEKLEGPIKFTGNTFLQYRNRGYKSNSTFENVEDYIQDEEYELPYHSNYDLPGRKGERGNKYEIKLRTFKSDGLVLWRSKSMSLKADYLSMALVNGYPEFSYNLGMQKTFWAIKSPTRVDDGHWHTIQIWRRKRIGFISVDMEPEVKGIAESGEFTLNTNSKLWIGGAPSLPAGLPSAYYTGFEGCIHHVRIHTKPLNLTKTARNERTTQAPTILRFCNDNEI